MFSKFSYLFYLFIILAIAWATGLSLFVAMIPKEAATDKANTDAIVVLTGGSHRLERGFELLAQGRAPRMFISGVENGITVPSLLRNKEYREFANKIPPGSVILGYKAHSTSGNASEIAEWATKENITSIRIVTGNYHIPRSIHEIRQAISKLIIIPEPVFTKHFENNNWWQSWESTRLVISEYHKYMASFILSEL